MSKSKWKNQMKEKIGKSTVERTKQEMANKIKARTLVEDKWEKCEKAKMFTLSTENSKEEWEEITEIYRKNKRDNLQ